MKKSNKINKCATGALSRSVRRQNRQLRSDVRLKVAKKIDSNPTKEFLGSESRTHVFPTSADKPVLARPQEERVPMYIDANLTVPAQFIQSISREMVRSHFEVLSRSFNDFAFDADARIDELRKSLNDFKVELQKSDFSRSQNLAQDIANKLGMSTKSLFTSGANRQFATALKAVLATELKSLEDFEDPLLSARGLLDRYEICLRDGQMKT